MQSKRQPRHMADHVCGLNEGKVGTTASRRGKQVESRVGPSRVQHPAQLRAMRQVGPHEAGTGDQNGQSQYGTRTLIGRSHTPKMLQTGAQPCDMEGASSPRE